MEAKDTVLKPQQIVEAMSEWKDDNGIAWEDWAAVMTKQALVSFRAGCEETDSQWDKWRVKFIPKALAEARKAGIREVIEWGLETCPHDLFGEGTQCFKRACDLCWQEKWDVS